MAGETAFPHGQHLQRVGEIIVGFIKQAMTQSCTHNSEDEHIEQKLVQRIGSHLLATVDATHDKIADKKAQSPQKAVPTDMDVADGEQNGVDVPGDVV